MAENGFIPLRAFAKPNGNGNGNGADAPKAETAEPVCGRLSLSHKEKHGPPKGGPSF